MSWQRGGGTPFLGGNISVNGHYVDDGVKGFKNGRTRNGLEGTYATRIWFSTEGIVTPATSKLGTLSFFHLNCIVVLQVPLVTLLT